MKIGIQAWGTDGDIGPLVAIAVELAKRNHSVNLEILPFKDRDFSFLESNKNINYRIIKFPQQKYLKEYFFNNMEIWDKNNENRNTILISRFECIKDELKDSALRLAIDSDILLGTQHTLFLNCAAAAKQIPYFSLAYEHTLARSIYTPPPGQENLGIENNIKAWCELENNINERESENINAARRLFDAPPVSSVLDEVANSRLLNLISYSPVLFPWTQDDWKDTHKTCGYIYSDQFYSSWKPLAELQNFLDEGKTPLFICLSNMIVFENNLKNLQNMIIDAVEKSNNRAIFLSDWVHNDESVPNIFKLKGFVHLPQILSKCALLIHAGGTGFTHDAAKSGTPSLVIPYGFDQIYNSEILKAHGICDVYIERSNLNADALSNAIKVSLKNPNLAIKAKEISMLMREENGPSYAADAIEEKYFSLKRNEPEIEPV